MQNERGKKAVHLLSQLQVLVEPLVFLRKEVPLSAEELSSCRRNILAGVLQQMAVQLAERLKISGLRGRNALRFETVSKTIGSCLVLVRQQTKSELKGCHLRVADLSQSGESQGGRERPPLRRRCPCPRRTRSPAILGTLCRRGFGGFRGWAPAGTLAGPRFDLVGDSEQEPDLCETKCKGAYLVLLDARRFFRVSFFGTERSRLRM